MNTAQPLQAGTGPARSARSRWQGCLGCLLLLFLAVPVGAALLFGLDALLDAPWAYPVASRSTLTGTWLGEFKVPSGTRFALLLDVQHQPLSNGALHADEALDPLINGQGSWCDDRVHRAEAIPLEGQVPLFSGYGGSASQVEIDLRSADHPQPGLQPAYSNGNWKGETLTLQFKLIFWDSQTQALVSSTANPDFTPPPTVSFKKADAAAFQAACAGLARSQN